MQPSAPISPTINSSQNQRVGRTDRADLDDRVADDLGGGLGFIEELTPQLNKVKHPERSSACFSRNAVEGCDGSNSPDVSCDSHSVRESNE